MHMKKIGIFITQYSLLVYLLVSNDWHNTKFIFAGSRISSEIIRKLGLYVNIPVSGERAERLGETINKCNNFILKWFLRVVYKSLRIYMKIKFSVWKFFHRNKYIRVYGQDHAEMASVFLNCNFTLIEDGAINYTPYEQLLKVLNAVGFSKLDKYCPFGWSNSVKTIYLSGRGKIPVEIEHKVKVFNLNEQWKNKTMKEKKEIMDIFDFDYNKMYNIVSSGRNIFLLTQNLSPLYFSDLELIDIYRKILSSYKKENIVIKPHPADHIRYEEVFPDCIVLREEFPFELMYFAAIPIKKVVSIDSTAIMGVWDSFLIDSHPEYSPHEIL